jgi:hypothetical protein
MRRPVLGDDSIEHPQFRKGSLQVWQFTPGHEYEPPAALLESFKARSVWSSTIPSCAMVPS